MNTLNGHTGPVRSAAYSPDGLKIVSGSHDNSIKIWDADTGLLLNTLNGHTSWVLSVAYSNLIISAIDVKLKEHIKKLNQ